MTKRSKRTFYADLLERSDVLVLITFYRATIITVMPSITVVVWCLYVATIINHILYLFVSDPTTVVVFHMVDMIIGSNLWGVWFKESLHPN
jgi:hypothetical protein